MPRGLATTAVARCTNLVEDMMRQVVVVGGVGTRESGYGLYELMHAVTDSFSYAHAERMPGTHGDRLPARLGARLRAPGEPPQRLLRRLPPAARRRRPARQRVHPDLRGEQGAPLQGAHRPALHGSRSPASPRRATWRGRRWSSSSSWCATCAWRRLALPAGAAHRPPEVGGLEGVQGPVVHPGEPLRRGGMPGEAARRARRDERHALRRRSDHQPEPGLLRRHGELPADPVDAAGEPVRVRARRRGRLPADVRERRRTSGVVGAGLILGVPIDHRSGIGFYPLGGRYTFGGLRGRDGRSTRRGSCTSSTPPRTSPSPCRPGRDRLAPVTPRLVLRGGRRLHAHPEAGRRRPPHPAPRGDRPRSTTTSGLPSRSGTDGSRGGRPPGPSSSTRRRSRRPPRRTAR